MPTDISLLRKIINYKTLIISVSFFGVLCNCVMNTVSSFSCWVFWILCNLYLLKDVTFFRVRSDLMRCLKSFTCTFTFLQHLGRMQRWRDGIVGFNSVQRNSRREDLMGKLFSLKPS